MGRFGAFSGIAVIFTVVLSACSSGGGTPGTVLPGSGASSEVTSSSTVSSLPFAGAPKVQNPLPATVLSGDPCVDALNSEQVTAALGVSVQGKREKMATGPFCSWANSSPASGAQITVGYDTSTHTGLSSVYQNTKPQSNTWKELSVEGFPAAAHDSAQDHCHISVGLADDLSVQVGGFLSRAKTGELDPCEAAAKVAGAVVTTLRQKA
ncbi:DUF3558 domain-containing protein [Amycolatopsis sp. BJA-103]|uniref:DUF3558 domain-containing protein n=1 Tax=Amycolatopsis sp. BJA-103 TaxID=1911175 RepID=UPI000C786BA3|nr:DUF3558 domain-containing protein [Amycolatopsis sp. BJA-103]PNE15556.1 hypothetical protein B1H26_30025 [Amycolatopsis sp. BJA-103]